MAKVLGTIFCARPCLRDGASRSETVPHSAFRQSRIGRPATRPIDTPIAAPIQIFFTTDPLKGRKAVVSIKKEVQQFIIACEKLHRLLSRGEQLTCHEAEILYCCIDELTKRRV